MRLAWILYLSVPTSIMALEARMHPDSPARQEEVRQRPGVNTYPMYPMAHFLTHTIISTTSRWPQYLCLKGGPLQCELHGLNLSNLS